MTRRELDAAGITDPALRAAYTRCRQLNARHGQTCFLATRLLPPERRSAVHALYGFARWADDIDQRRSPEQRDRELRRLESDLRAPCVPASARDRWCGPSPTPPSGTASSTCSSRTSCPRCVPTCP